MNSMKNTINTCMKDDLKHYNSNDSGLSGNSNGGCDSDHRNVSVNDFQCDDLTKSLFENSFGGNEIIQDDDIFSYKSKMEISHIFPNKFRSLNLTKVDNFNFKNSGNFSSIIQDVENLKNPNLYNNSKLANNIIAPKDDVTGVAISNSSFRISDEMRSDSKFDIQEKVRSKRSTKKNSVQEYVSSSIKDYQGDKALNDIVSFIQGSPKHRIDKVIKSKATKTPSIKVDECQSINSDFTTVTDSGIVSDHSSHESKDTSQSNIDVDSGTQSSPFISPNNSDEDMSQLTIEDFKEVLPRKQKKIISSKLDNQHHSPTLSKPTSNMKYLSSNKPAPNKVKKSNKAKTQTKPVNFNSLLNTRESFHNFLSDQYLLFVKKYQSVS